MQSISINRNSFYILYMMNYFLLYCLSNIFVTRYILFGIGNSLPTAIFLPSSTCTNKLEKQHVVNYLSIIRYLS